MFKTQGSKNWNGLKKSIFTVRQIEHTVTQFVSNSIGGG
jgi:hypothetical protein